MLARRKRLESSDSRFPSSEDSLDVPRRLQAQAVEEHPKEQEAATTYESAAPRSLTGIAQLRMRKRRGIARGGGA